MIAKIKSIINKILVWIGIKQKQVTVEAAQVTEQVTQVADTVVTEVKKEV